MVEEATASFKIPEGLLRTYDKILSAIEHVAQVFSGQHVMKSSESVRDLWLSCRGPVRLFGKLICIAGTPVA
jgi:hypothetical protein